MYYTQALPCWDPSREYFYEPNEEYWAFRRGIGTVTSGSFSLSIDCELGIEDWFPIRLGIADRSFSTNTLSFFNLSQQSSPATSVTTISSGSFYAYV